MKNILILILGLFLLVLPLSFAEIDLNDELIAYWDLDTDDATPDDQLGDNDWTTNTGTSFAASCKNNGCMDVTGQGNRGIHSGGVTGWDTTDGEFTFAGWWLSDDIEGGCCSEHTYAGQLSGTDSTQVGWDDPLCNTEYNLIISSNGAGWDIEGSGCSTGLTLSQDTWHHHVYGYNGTDYFVYIDGVQYYGLTDSTHMQALDEIHFGDTAAGNTGDAFWKGKMDEQGIWSRGLSKEEIEELYNTGDGLFATGGSFPIDEPPIVATTAFTLTGTDTYNGSALENITVFITNSSFSFSQSTSNGTIILLNSSFTFNSTYDIKFASNQSGGYLNHSFNSINITERGSFQGDLFQSRVIVNAKEVITNNTILSFTASVPLQTNSSNITGQSVLLLKAGSYDLIGDAAGYMLRGFNFTVNPKQEINVNITLGTANLTITALSSAGVINYFNTTITLLSTGFSETIETNTGTAVFSTIPGFFNVSINPADWTFDHKTITITTEDTLPNITFNLFSKNSINITIFDEETNEIIDYTTTTLIMDHISQKFTNTTTSGNVFFIELFDGLWDLLISTAFHNQREYIFTIVPQTTSRLNVYLLNSSNGDLTTFNIKNKEDQTLPGSTISVSNKINNTFVTVAQSVSDFAGQSNIFLSSTNEYRFTIEADTFTTKIFDLVPLANAYDIIMDPIDALDFTTIYDVLSYTMIPASILTPQQEQNISFITSSPLGYISYFGLNSSFNSTTNRITNVSGSLAGGTASIFINTTDHTGTHIPVDFFIKIAGEPEIRIHHSYRTSLFITPGNISSVSIADKYKDSFTNVGKSLIIVIGAVAVILSLAEAGAPALANGIAGAIVIIFGVIIGWISPAVGIIITFITVTMVIFRRAD